MPVSGTTYGIYHLIAEVGSGAGGSSGGNPYDPELGSPNYLSFGLSFS